MKIKKIGLWLTPGLLLVWLISMFRLYGGFEVKVTSSGKPVEGTAVALNLFYNVFGLGDTSQRLVLAVEGQTGDDGTLHIPKQLAFRPGMVQDLGAWFGYWELDPQIIVWKPGFSLVEMRLPDNRNFNIKRLSGANRLKNYQGINVRPEILDNSRILIKLITDEQKFLGEAS